MRNILMMLLTLFCTCYAQNLKLGGTGNFAIGGNHFEYLFGPALKIHYEFDNWPIAVQANANFYLGNFSVTSINVSSYTDAAVGGTVIYYPFRFPVQPYAGVSILYNINSMSQEGNQNFIILERVDNNFSTELLFGLNLTPEDRVNFIAEFAYSINKPEYISYHRDQKHLRSAGSFDINSLYLRIGVLFNI